MITYTTFTGKIFYFSLVFSLDFSLPFSLLFPLNFLSLSLSLCRSLHQTLYVFSTFYLFYFFFIFLNFLCQISLSLSFYLFLSLFCLKISWSVFLCHSPLLLFQKRTFRKFIIMFAWLTSFAPSTPMARRASRIPPC